MPKAAPIELKYEYTPLHRQGKHIRVLILQAGDFGDELRIGLPSVPLKEDRCVEYEALSYTWGSSEQPATISVLDLPVKPGSRVPSDVSGDLDRGGQSELQSAENLAITANLETALQYLRLPDRHRTLWVDAICINQEDVDERGQQVELMGQIYKNARRVIVWLGPEADDSALAIKTLSSLGSQFEVDRDSVFPRLKATAWEDPPWVADHGDRRPQPSSESSLRIGKVYELVQVNSRPRLLDLLDVTNGAECTDARDRIYCLINLVSDFDSIYGLKPNYAADARSVFQEVVRRYWNTHGGLDILTCCELRNTQVEQPSWVPDWSKPKICRPLLNQMACGMAKSNAVFADVTLLRVHAVHVATINHTKKLLLDSQSIEDYDAISSALRSIWITMIDRDQLYLGGGDQLDAFCKTVIGGEIADFFLPPLKPYYPLLSDLKKIVLELLPSSGRPLPQYAGPYSAIGAVLSGRSFFRTKEGHMGIAPDTALPDDQICVVLGCQTPLALRSDRSGCYQVVGECYVPGIMDCEALLGPLPGRWERGNMVHFPEDGPFPGFMIRETRETRVEDPRLGPLPEGWRIFPNKYLKSFYQYVNDETREGYGDDFSTVNDLFDPRMTARALRERGVNVQKLDLI